MKHFFLVQQTVCLRGKNSCPGETTIYIFWRWSWTITPLQAYLTYIYLWIMCKTHCFLDKRVEWLGWWRIMTKRIEAIAQPYSQTILMVIYALFDLSMPLTLPLCLPRPPNALCDYCTLRPPTPHADTRRPLHPSAPNYTSRLKKMKESRALYRIYELHFSLSKRWNPCYLIYCG